MLLGSVILQRSCAGDGDDHSAAAGLCLLSLTGRELPVIANKLVYELYSGSAPSSTKCSLAWWLRICSYRKWSSSTPWLAGDGTADAVLCCVVLCCQNPRHALTRSGMDGQ